MLAKDGTRNKRFLWRCAGCKQQFAVRVGTKNRHLSSRARLCLRSEGHKRMPKVPDTKTPVMAMVQRNGEGRALVVPTVTARNVRETVPANVDTSARLMTDENNLCPVVGQLYAKHQAVKHCLYEYVSGDAHSNSAESFFPRLKGQLYGTHHAVSKKHLHATSPKWRSRTIPGGWRMGSGVRAASQVLRHRIMVTGAGVAFPFVREMVANLTGRGRLGPQWLNPINFAKHLKPENEGQLVPPTL